MNENTDARTALLLGEDALQRLAGKRVAVFGLGGVGGMAAEALVRSGVGRVLLVDFDTVSPSNINRQVLALHSTVGRLKVDVARERLLDIRPDLVIETHAVFILPEGSNGLVKGCDYVVDAIDSVPSKVGLLLECLRERIPVISCMGAGNKLDPSRFEVADLYATSVCPLCRVMRHELRKAGVTALNVVYSREQPLLPIAVDLPGHPELEDDRADADSYPPKKRRPPGSVSFVPPAAGLVAAGKVIRDLLASG